MPRSRSVVASRDMLSAAFSPVCVSQYAILTGVPSKCCRVVSASRSVEDSLPAPWRAVDRLILSDLELHDSPEATTLRSAGAAAQPVRPWSLAARSQLN